MTTNDPGHGNTPQWRPTGTGGLPSLMHQIRPNGEHSPAIERAPVLDLGHPSAAGVAVHRLAPSGSVPQEFDGELWTSSQS
jgi:hypothetical protein